MNPTGQLIREALHTSTLYIYIEDGHEPCWSIEHRDVAYCYTIYI